MFDGTVEVFVCYINGFIYELFDSISFAKVVGVGAGVDFDKSDFSRF